MTELTSEEKERVMKVNEGIKEWLNKVDERIAARKALKLKKQYDKADKLKDEINKMYVSSPFEEED